MVHHAPPRADAPARLRPEPLRVRTCLFLLWRRGSGCAGTDRSRVVGLTDGLTRLTVCIPRLLHRYKNKLILFGGTCGSFFYNHLFEYDTVEQVR